MGYILTPTQTENDNKLINDTPERLKTANLFKQSTTQNTNHTQKKADYKEKEKQQNLHQILINQAYTSITTVFLDKPHGFSNHKLAMLAKARLLENFDDNANISNEIFKRHNTIDKLYLF
ncbi:MAG: hypothetical protein SPJ83_02975 [Helicobacter sp.]|uniref:hypothetical protein n=1 Tax=Helicobacter sp. TaxID=218 RepID=UPI002A910413|nr:hypothetical protein [Helicobacter sp.]MDY5821750.1 hypothetical protein [Helicobacter sp.]